MHEENDKVQGLAIPQLYNHRRTVFTQTTAEAMNQIDNEPKRKEKQISQVGLSLCWPAFTASFFFFC